MYIQFWVFFSTFDPFFDQVPTSEMAGKIFTHQNGDENAQSARELASKKSCVRLSCVRHRSDIELASVTGLRVYCPTTPYHDYPIITRELRKRVQMSRLDPFFRVVSVFFFSNRTIIDSN